jgi:hypothetical protein
MYAELKVVRFSGTGLGERKFWRQWGDLSFYMVYKLKRQAEFSEYIFLESPDLDF